MRGGHEACGAAARVGMLRVRYLTPVQALASAVPSRKYKKKHLSKLNCETQINILKACYLGAQTHKDIAKSFRVSLGTVTYLTRKLKTDSSFLIKLKEKEEGKVLATEKVHDHVEQCLLYGVQIENAAFI